MTDDIHLGGGSGGDPGGDDRGHRIKSTAGTYEIRGNQVMIVSWKNIPPAEDQESRVMILATGGLDGAFMDQGTVDVRGVKGVRITSGPFIPGVNPVMSAESTAGIEIEAGETQTVTIKRGVLPVADQYITMTKQGITVNAGIGGTLTLAAGLNQITLGPSGITMIGMPVVQINPGPPAPELPPLPEDEPAPPTDDTIG